MRFIHTIRFFLAEIFLAFAYEFMPQGNEKEALERWIVKYGKLIKI